MGDLSIQSSLEFETSVKKWMSSPGEKMDLWHASITVDSEVKVALSRKGASSSWTRPVTPSTP